MCHPASKTEKWSHIKKKGDDSDDSLGVGVPVSLVILDVSLQLVEHEAGADEGKFLLRHVSAQVDSGEVLSIMGPSGAGKTTLLNVLTCEPVAGRADSINGDTMLNGQPLNVNLFRDQCAYVAQMDNGLFTFLTCIDHIT